MRHLFGIVAVIVLVWLPDIHCLECLESPDCPNCFGSRVGSSLYYKYGTYDKEGIYISHKGWEKSGKSSTNSPRGVTNTTGTVQTETTSPNNISENSSRVALIMINSSIPLKSSHQDYFITMRKGYVTLQLTLYSLTTYHEPCFRRWHGPVSATVDLEEDFNIKQFQNLLIPGQTSRKCVRWEPRSGEWTEDGCTTRNSNATRISCECTGSETFGVKVEVEVLRNQTLLFIALSAATSISATFILVTLLSLVKFRASLKSPDRRLFIQLNMTISILLFNVSFLFVFAMIMEPMYNERLCEAIALLNVFFELTSVIWMFFEALVIFEKVCLTYITVSRRTMHIIAGVAWTVPIAIVGAIQAFDTVMIYSEAYVILKSKLGAENVPETQRKYNFCCPHPHRGGLVLYVCVAGLIFLLNILVVVWVGAVVWRKTVADRDVSYTPDESRRKKKNNLAQTKAVLHAVVILMLMLGIPWLLSLLINLWMISIETKFIHYAFVVIQGPIIFYLYCAKNRALHRAAKRSRTTKRIIKSITSSHTK